MSLDIHWESKSFNELSNNELYDALKLRIDVFVVEQTCYYPDLDDKDRHPNTIHLLGYKYSPSSEKKLAAYARILPKGQTYNDYISIGRVITAPFARGLGLGHKLMQKALLVCHKIFSHQNIKISAQEHLEKYYGQYGFVRASEMYLEDDIPHIAMIKKVSK